MGYEIGRKWKSRDNIFCRNSILQVEVYLFLKITYRQDLSIPHCKLKHRIQYKVKNCIMIDSFHTGYHLTILHFKVARIKDLHFAKRNCSYVNFQKYFQKLLKFLRETYFVIVGTVDPSVDVCFTALNGLLGCYEFSENLEEYDDFFPLQEVLFVLYNHRTKAYGVFEMINILKTLCCFITCA